MADIVKLAAELRGTFGKGAARKLRRAGRVPAVAYGHGADPVHLSFDAHDIFMATRQANALLSVDLDGQEMLAIVKEMQRNPISRDIEHVDLLRVKKGEKVEVEVPVEVVGESAPGTIHTIELMHVLVKAPATALPEAIEVDVTGLEEGQHVTVADLKLPQDVDIELDPQTVVVVVSLPEVDTALEESDAAAAEAASAEAAAAAGTEEE